MPAAKRQKKTVELSPLEAAKTSNDLIKLSVTDLDGLGRRLNQVRRLKSSLADEEDRLKALIFSHQKVKVGYQDKNLKISEIRLVDVSAPETLAYLVENKLLSQVSDVKISPKKVRELSEQDEDLAETLVWIPTKQIRSVTK